MEMRLRMFRKICALLVVVLVTINVPASAQGNLSKENTASISAVEDSLLVMADSMYNAIFPDQRVGISERFARQLVRALKVNSSWNYPFEKLGKKINIIYPEDKAFRIFNWAVAPTDISLRYYGCIQMQAEQLKLYGLVDYSAEVTKGAADSVYTGGKWFGAIYYRIIDKEVDGRKIYTLFGMNVGSNSNRKVLEALEITDKGPRFGAQIFGINSELFPGQRINRFVLEYKKDVQASMNWDSELKVIFFDRLVSQINDPGRKYTYVPSGQYDGFRWGNGEWRFVQDVIAPLQLKDGEAPVNQPK